MAAAWKAAWATSLGMLYMPSNYAYALQQNESEAIVEGYDVLAGDCVDASGVDTYIRHNGPSGGSHDECKSACDSLLSVCKAYVVSSCCCEWLYVTVSQDESDVPSGSTSPIAAGNTDPGKTCYRRQATTQVSGTGDPHLQNVHGERFDLTRPGKFALIHIPRGQPVEDALLVVEADARQIGKECTDMYFVKVNVTGAWADAAQAGGLRFDVDDARDEAPKWAKLGPVELKVVRGRTAKGIKYLNVFVKHLVRAGFVVGGLLGEDDHEDVSAPQEGCVHRTSLNRHVAPEFGGSSGTLQRSSAEWL